MRSFIELCAKGNRRLVIESSAILGVIMAPNRGKTDLSTPESPCLLIVRGAEPIEIIGIEPAMIFAQMAIVAQRVDELKDGDSPLPIAIQWLERDEAEAA